jgi:AraC family transcriptional regulator
MATSYETRINRVLEHIHDNPAGDLSLDALSDVAAMSRFHWHRVFHAMTGETLAQAVRRIRLHRAGYLLVTSDKPVAKIALDMGYASVQSFSRAFSLAHGLSPVRFRTRGQMAPLPHPPIKGAPIMYEVTLETRAAATLHGFAHKGPYIEIGRAFEALAAKISANNRWADVIGSAGVYYDDPSAVAAADLRSHAGVFLAEGATPPEGVEAVTLDGGRFAVLHFKGAYAGLPRAYDYLYCDWLGSSGEEPRDAPCFEVYLNDPRQVAPEDLLTDVFMPIQ